MSESTEPLPLEKPIKRGETKIEAVCLRRPGSGELRGLQLQALLQGDVNNVLGLLPRVTVPPLTGPEVETLDPADLAMLTGAIQGFFTTRTEQALMAKIMGMAEQGAAQETSTA